VTQVKKRLRPFLILLPLAFAVLLGPAVVNAEPSLCQRLAAEKKLKQVPVARYCADAKRIDVDTGIIGKNRLTRKERDARIYVAYRDEGYTLKEIAAYLGVHCATVSRAVRRVEKRALRQGLK